MGRGTWFRVRSDRARYRHRRSSGSRHYRRLPGGVTRGYRLRCSWPDTASVRCGRFRSTVATTRWRLWAGLSGHSHDRCAVPFARSRPDIGTDLWAARSRTIGASCGCRGVRCRLEGVGGYRDTRPVRPVLGAHLITQRIGVCWSWFTAERSHRDSAADRQHRSGEQPGAESAAREPVTPPTRLFVSLATGSHLFCPTSGHRGSRPRRPRTSVRRLT